MPDMPYAGGKPCCQDRLGISRGEAADARGQAVGCRSGDNTAGAWSPRSPGKSNRQACSCQSGRCRKITQEDWQKERDKMVKTCNQCHSVNFAKAELEKGDQMIREADRLMAEGIRIVGDLYKDGIL